LSRRSDILSNCCLSFELVFISTCMRSAPVHQFYSTDLTFCLLVGSPWTLSNVTQFCVRLPSLLVPYNSLCLLNTNFWTAQGVLWKQNDSFSIFYHFSISYILLFYIYIFSDQDEGKWL
jgi:hypothetical protein